MKSIAFFGKSKISSSFFKNDLKSQKINFSTKKEKVLNINTISSKVKNAEYAVRGELVIKAAEHGKTLDGFKSRRMTEKDAVNSLPFEDIVFCNIGNPQSLGQQPLTVFRQYLALVEFPELLQSEYVDKIFYKDVIERANQALKETLGGTGAYTHSQGLPFVRKHIAEFIEKRDGYPANPDDIFIHNGASPAVQDILKLTIRNEKDGIMIPIPQYPLYSASISMLGGSQIGYLLNEETGWGLDKSELERSYKEAKSKGLEPRCLVIINPGNPTGQILKEENMREVIEFCHKYKLVLLADEVYQENVYFKKEKPFLSFKKVLRSMGDQFLDFELFSFHSISKGFVGECGHRGGYVEIVGIDPQVKAEIYKLSSVNLCPNTAGQILMDIMVNPPTEGSESYNEYKTERDDILVSLKRRALKLTKFLDSLEGISCNSAEGAMYAFPQIKLTKKAVAAAKKAGKKPDDFYALSLLDATGICVVPGSGFGQKDGTYHFRTTFLPSEDQIDSVMQKLGKFHSEFLLKYKD